LIVEFGNVAQKNAKGEAVTDLGGAPSVTELVIPDNYSFDKDVNLEEFKSHIYEASRFMNGVTHRPDDEALLVADGFWGFHSFAKPSWVASSDVQLAKAIAALYDVPLGKPSNVEDSHWTKNGAPGTWLTSPKNLLVNSGRDIWARMQGGGVLGINGVSTTAPTGTTYTCTGASAPGSTSYWNGQYIVAGSTSVGLVYANIISNTNASPPVLTVDQWMNFSAPGAGAATTPVAGPFAIVNGAAPAFFVGLGNTNTSPSAGDTSMSGEITTAGGGLIRKIAPWAHTAGTNTYTLTPVFTANGTDSLPVTAYRIGVFISPVASNTTASMMFETSLSASATLSASGDQLTVTETVTGS
jgi:hypothetical protein